MDRKEMKNKELDLEELDLDKMDKVTGGSIIDDEPGEWPKIKVKDIPDDKTQLQYTMPRVFKSDKP